MKKFFALLIAILMMATLVACSDKDDTGNPLETLGVDDNTFSNNELGTFTYEVGVDGHYEITGYLVNKATEHEVVIPGEIGGVLVTGIGTKAFKSLNCITKIPLPESVERVGDYAFADCDKLTTVFFTDSVNELGKGLFRDCALINNVDIPTLVTKIPEECFFNCPSLSAIDLRGGIDLTVIGKAAFFNCDALVSFSIPATVTEIQETAFYDCDKLAKINVPASVTTIKDAAFAEISSEKLAFPTPEGSAFAKYFSENFAINEKDYSHYKLEIK